MQIPPMSRRWKLQSNQNQSKKITVYKKINFQSRKRPHTYLHRVYKHNRNETPLLLETYTTKKREEAYNHYAKQR